ncbi:probable F-actin-capping protein subunit beta [Tanacetum coccineum]
MCPPRAKISAFTPGHKPLLHRCEVSSSRVRICDLREVGFVDLDELGRVGEMKNEVLVDYGIRNADVISVLLENCILCVFGMLNCDLGEVAVKYYRILHVLCDEDSGKEFILCEYNRDADSYRSPWSNKFHPHLDDGMYPSEELRKLEVEANEVFTIYRDQYYEGGISSVYLWEEDDNEGFVACFLIKKDGSKYAHGKRGYLHEGGWEAIHVIQVGPDEEGMAHYCLTSTIMLSLTTDSDTSGTFNLSGSIRRQMKADLSVEDGHLCNMGKMIEELQGKLRNQLDQSLKLSVRCKVSP